MTSRSTSVFPEVEDETKDQVQPLYHVILLNDEDHTYDYVIEMLVKIFAMTESKALSHAVEVDTAGTTILLTCDLEKAELKRDQIHAYGKDVAIASCKGSMKATIDPVE